MLFKHKSHSSAPRPVRSPGLTVGSEGTFGVVTRAWVRLLRLPPETVTFLAAYDTIESAGAAVSALVASGVVPAALMASSFLLR